MNCLSPLGLGGGGGSSLFGSQTPSTGLGLGGGLGSTTGGGLGGGLGGSTGGGLFGPTSTATGEAQRSVCYDTTKISIGCVIRGVEQVSFIVQHVV